MGYAFLKALCPLRPQVPRLGTSPTAAFLPSILCWCALWGLLAQAWRWRSEIRTRKERAKGPDYSPAYPKGLCVSGLRGCIQDRWVQVVRRQFLTHLEAHLLSSSPPRRCSRRFVGFPHSQSWPAAQVASCLPGEPASSSTLEVSRPAPDYSHLSGMLRKDSQGRTA